MMSTALTDPDAALMLRVKQGDRAAFEELVEKYRQPVMNLVYRTLPDAIEAQDLKAAKQELAAGEDVNQQGPGERTPLIDIRRGGCTRNVACLIDVAQIGHVCAARTRIAHCNQPIPHELPLQIHVPLLQIVEGLGFHPYQS